MASRQELFSKLGLTKPVAEPILDAAYQLEEEQIWKEDLQSSPHGEHWHTSFHASNFPGDNPKACGRAALYTLMNIPADGPVGRAGRAVMEVGKDIENRIVERFHRAGVLLSNSPDNETQTGFEDKEYWLTGSPDALIYSPIMEKPHVVEVKSKDGIVVEQMQSGKRSFDPVHRSQTLTYIGLSNENQKMWPEFDACETGSILYVSRNRPSETHEFKFRLNEGFMEEGRVKLKTWKEAFLEDNLPERPKSWKWTETPCKWCSFKKRCKQDYQEEVSKLSKSNTIKLAEETYDFDYSYEKTRQSILDRWG